MDRRVEVQAGEGDPVTRSKRSKMAPPGVQRHVETRETFRIDVDAATLLEALRALYPEIPSGAEIRVTIRSGGDWSGCDLEVGDEIPAVVVRWEISRIEDA